MSKVREYVTDSRYKHIQTTIPVKNITTHTDNLWRALVIRWMELHKWVGAGGLSMEMMCRYTHTHANDTLVLCDAVPNTQGTGGWFLKLYMVYKNVVKVTSFQSRMFWTYKGTNQAYTWIIHQELNPYLKGYDKRWCKFYETLQVEKTSFGNFSYWGKGNSD